MGRSIEFPPFRLDLDGGRLQRGADRIALRPKAMAVLCHLAARPGCAVSKAELMAAVWPDTHVDAAALKVCINELRRALGDDARAPAVLETVRGRGYRFVPEVQGVGSTRPSRVPPCFVGRARELAALDELFADALRGVRRMVFVSGDAGIGKTSLVEAFLDAVAERARRDDAPVACGVGHCADRPGAGDVLQPFVDVLADAVRGPDEVRLRDMLRDVAPSWLVRLPGPLPPAERDVLRQLVAGTTRAAVVRELAHALRAVSEVRPLVLVLEDLHRADDATHDAIAALARGDDRGRILLVGTVRPSEPPRGSAAIATLVHDLARRHLVRELRLEPFDVDEVRAYLARRLGAGRETALAVTLTAHTGGNPLFVSTVADYLDASGEEAGAAAIDAGTLAGRVPESLRRLLADDLDRLPAAERATLEVASVAGVRFAAPALAGALAEPVEAIESRLGTISRLRTLIRACGSARWADGREAAVFEFVHATHRDVVHDLIAPARLARLHAAVGASLERALTAAGGDVGDRAGELALHFDAAGDVARARRYHERAGMLASERHAHGTAVAHFERALALLPPATEDGQSLRDELRLRTALGPMLMNARSFGSPDVERNYARALELCRRAGEHPDLFPVLEGLQSHYSINGRLTTAYELSQRMQALASRLREPAMELEALHTTGIDLFKLGEPARAREHLEAALALYDETIAEQGFRWCGHDARVCCATHLGVCRWHGGWPTGAGEACADALAHARRLRQPASVGIALVATAWLRIQHGDAPAALEHLDELMRLSADEELPFWSATAGIFVGWARTMVGDVDGARTALDDAGALALTLGRRVLAVEHRLISAGLRAACGDGAAALALLADAETLHAESGETYLRGDIALLRGTVLLAGGGLVRPDARAALRAALAFGEGHGFRPLALRAAVLLSYCGDGEDPRREALAALERTCAAFTDGASLPEVQMADARRRELAGLAGGD